MSSLGRKLNRSKKPDFMTRQAGFRALEERIVRHTGAEGVSVIRTAPGQPKLSEALMALIEPYIVPNETTKMRHALLTMGVLAWNSTLVDEEMVLDMLAATTGAMAADEKVTALLLVGALAERKIEMFPEDTRFIVDFELQDTGSSYNLVVAATPTAGVRLKNRKMDNSSADTDDAEATG